MTNSWDCTDFDSVAGCAPAAGRRYYPFPTQTVEKGWDLNGTALPITQTTTVQDCTNASPTCYGNTTSVTVTTLNPDGTVTGYSKTTTNQYNNDLTNWYLGRLIRSTVTSTAP
jgi:hypothetical protein